VSEASFDPRPFVAGARWRLATTVADWLYWPSRSLWTPGQNLNRRPVADVEGQPEHEQRTLPV
jgi:hypothetical protein